MIVISIWCLLTIFPLSMYFVSKSIEVNLRESLPNEEQHLRLDSVTWEQYEALLSLFSLV